MREVPTDAEAFRRLRRRAVWVTLALGVPFLWNVLVATVVLARGGDTRFGILPFLAAAVFLAGLVVVAVPAWRRTVAARPVHLLPDATRGERYGIPGLDEHSGPHRGLSGEQEPPRRW